MKGSPPQQDGCHGRSLNRGLLSPWASTLSLSYPIWIVADPFFGVGFFFVLTEITDNILSLQLQEPEHQLPATGWLWSLSCGWRNVCVIKNVHFIYQYQRYFYFLASTSGKESGAVASTSDCVATSSKGKFCEGAVVLPAFLLVLSEFLLVLMLSLKSSPRPSEFPVIKL